MSDEHETDRPAYDPSSPTPPEREPTLRTTAPQSAYSMSQVGLGMLILLVGLVLTFALPFVVG